MSTENDECKDEFLPVDILNGFGCVFSLPELAFHEIWVDVFMIFLWDHFFELGFHCLCAFV